MTHRAHAELIAEAEQAFTAAKRLVDEQTAIVRRLERTGGCNSEAVDLLNNLRELLAARERGIAAYRAWVPFERIRPTNISQEKWEEEFAWPANDKPPYPPLARRLLRGLMSYLIVILASAVLLQIFTPFPVLTWLGKLIKILVG